MPSTVEGFGIATIEAASAGIPYVNSNISIQKEITKGGRGGYLVNPSDPFAFSKKFELLLKDTQIYTKKIKDAHTLAGNYNWKEITKETEKIYKSLL